VSVHTIRDHCVSSSRVRIVLDFQDLIPTGYKPEALGSVKEWYVRAKNDRFYIDPPVWHRVYLLIELYYTLPMMVWGVWAYGRGMSLFSPTSRPQGQSDRRRPSTCPASDVGVGGPEHHRRHHVCCGDQRMDRCHCGAKE